MRSTCIILVTFCFLTCKDKVDVAIDDARELFANGSYEAAVKKLSEVPKNSKKWNDAADLDALCKITMAQKMEKDNNYEAAINILSTVSFVSRHFTLANRRRNVYEKELRIKNGGLSKELDLAASVKRVGEAINKVKSLERDFKETSASHQIEQLLESLIEKFLVGEWFPADSKQSGPLEGISMKELGPMVQQSNEIMEFARERTFEYSGWFETFRKSNAHLLNKAKIGADGQWVINLTGDGGPIIFAYPQLTKGSGPFPPRYQFTISSSSNEEVDILRESTDYEGGKGTDQRYWIRKSPRIVYQSR